MIEEVDRLKGKVEVRKQVSVRPKNRIEGGRSRNGIEQVGLNNFRVRSEEGTGPIYMKGVGMAVSVRKYLGKYNTS